MVLCNSTTLLWTLFICWGGCSVVFTAATVETNLIVPEEVLDVNVYDISENASLTDEVIISSPNFPDNYSDSTKVSYWIRGHGRPIQISKKSFALQANENNGTCLKDYLAIWDVRYQYYPKLVVCGNGSALPFYSYSDSVMMQFFSDKETNAPGFQLSVQVSRRCGEDALTCPTDKNKCVQPDYICDGRPDCPNGEDEICNRKCGIGNSEAREETSRIVGGVEAVKNAWPWQTVLLIAGSLCGGSLLAPGWVVTAAHCCTAGGEQPQDQRHAHDPSKFTVRLGFHSCKNSTDGITAAVEKVLIPGLYEQGRWGANFDMCLLKLKQKVTFSPTIQPICLPRPFSGPVGRQMCTATGCGSMVQWSGSGMQPPKILADNLMVVNLTVMDSNECYRQYAKLTPEMLCTLERDKDTCQGDSGGPLQCTGVDKSSPNQYQLSGIVSFGRGCASMQPGVFANSRRLLPFLAQMLYNEQKWGWFEDTSVPVVDHTTSLRSLFQPRVIATQTPSSRASAMVGHGAGIVYITLLCLVLFVYGLLHDH